MTLLTPLYCPNCQHLTLLHPLGLLDLKGTEFQEHPCKLYKKKNILDSQEIKDAIKITEETTEFYVEFPQKPGVLQKKDPDALLILGKDKEGYLKGFSSNAQLYKIKPLFEEHVPAGVVISMKGCHKIGQKKYRLSRLSIITPPTTITDLAQKAEEIYHLELTSFDQNLLEKITGQVVQLCLQEGITPYSVTIAYNPASEDSKAEYVRSISFDPSANLLAKINDYTFPDTVQIIVKQG